MKNIISLLIFTLAFASFGTATPDTHKSSDSPPGISNLISDIDNANISFEKNVPQGHIISPCIYCEALSNFPAETSPAEIFSKRHITAPIKNLRI